MQRRNADIYKKATEARSFFETLLSQLRGEQNNSRLITILIVHSPTHLGQKELNEAGNFFYLQLNICTTLS